MAIPEISSRFQPVCYFFPQLIAGPIVRAGKILPQLETRKQLTLYGVVISMLITFTLVALIWIPFRSADLPQSVHTLKQLFDAGLVFFNGLSVQQIVALAVLSLTLGYQYWRREKYLADLLYRVPYPIQAGLISIVMLTIALTSTGDTHAFIYFQF